MNSNCRLTCNNLKLSLGGTIPIEIQPYAEDGSESCYTNLKPDLVVVDRRSNDVHIFVVTIAGITINKYKLLFIVHGNEKRWILAY